MKFFKRLRARRAVVLAAKLVESSYEPGLKHEYDPDDLHHLRAAVRDLRALEGVVRG